MQLGNRETVNSVLIEMLSRGFDAQRVYDQIKNHRFRDRILKAGVERNNSMTSSAGRAFWKLGKLDEFSDVERLPQRIEMSGRLYHNGHKAFWDTFVHEVAHLLHPTNGHGSRWRRCAMAMGDDGKRCHEYEFMGWRAKANSKRPMARKKRRGSRKIVAICTKCNKQLFSRFKMKENVEYNCRKCGGRAESVEAAMLSKTVNEQVEAFITEKASKDERVIAVRADKMVGRGSCSYIDETMTDLELMRELEGLKVKTPTQARMACRKMHRERESYAEDIRNA